MASAVAGGGWEKEWKSSGLPTTVVIKSRLSWLRSDEKEKKKKKKERATNHGEIRVAIRKRFNSFRKIRHYQ